MIPFHHRIGIAVRYLAIPFILILIATQAIAETALLVPNATRDNNRLYVEITKGVKEHSPAATTIKTDPFFIGTTSREIESRYDKVIVLGKELIENYVETANPAPWIGGAFVDDIDTDILFNGLSLSVDPTLAFEELLKIKPGTRVIHVVVSNNANDDRLRAASDTARSLDIDLQIYVSENIRTTARYWFNIVRGINTNDEAIWLIDDEYMQESGSLKYIIEQSWARSIFTFTTVPNYARRGVALGFVPNVRDYGFQLSEKLDNTIRANKPKSIQYSGADIQIRVLNDRVITHLRLEMPADLDRLKQKDVVIR